jgi:diamine N-acetyltransferase
MNDKNYIQLNLKISIRKGNILDAFDLQKLAATTFQESHGHSASTQDIRTYIDSKFTLENLKAELNDAQNIFHFIYVEEKLAGYSKIILNAAYKNLTPKNSTKLERLYVLEKYHDLDIGKRLMDFNLHYSKTENQTGMWLYVWTENHRALRFYKKYNFQNIDETLFQISEQHSNPNWIMNLKY